MKNNIPTRSLGNSVQIPAIGLGTWPLNNAEAATTVSLALQSGYRLIDTAENYQNEAGVGLGIQQSGIPREHIFVTTKFNRKWHSIDGARQACEASLQRMQLDYLDLLLIHWPNPDQGRFVDAFAGLQHLLEIGLVRAIGTSNFKVTHLETLADAGFVPQVNQIQRDPYHPRLDLLAYHTSHHIITESWSPIGRGQQLLNEPAIIELAARYGKTPAQIILRWHTQCGCIPIPKSSNPEHLARNLDIFDITLTAEELHQLDQLAFDDPDMLDSDIFGH